MPASHRRSHSSRWGGGASVEVVASACGSFAWVTDGSADHTWQRDPLKRTPAQHGPAACSCCAASIEQQPSAVEGSLIDGPQPCGQAWGAPASSRMGRSYASTWSSQLPQHVVAASRQWRRARLSRPWRMTYNWLCMHACLLCMHVCRACMPAAHACLLCMHRCRTCMSAVHACLLRMPATPTAAHDMPVCAPVCVA
eukprot:352079-Chlamydomonas_euryale.AAC.3